MVEYPDNSDLLSRHMPNIMIVEDDEQTRSGLIATLSTEKEFKVVSAKANVAEAMTYLASDEAAALDVLLVDLGLPDGAGQDIIRAAASRPKPIEVMVITVFGDERNVVSAIEAGAAGYLLKDAAANSITEAVHELLAGGSPITPVIARHILRRFKPDPVPEPKAHDEALDGTLDEALPHLTPRETEVLQMVARGYTNNEIGELLGMSFHTVNSHVKQIYRKLSVRSRSEAVFEATQLGIISLQRGS
ncbi:MAG: response regulator transcription factor [Pseudomonadota bacterium]